MSVEFKIVEFFIYFCWQLRYNTLVKIADECNKDFCSIGKKLSDETNNLNPPNFNQYHPNRVCFFMFLHQTSVSKIFNLINHTNCNKSCGADGVDAS